MTVRRLGLIASLGVLAYAIGKFMTGTLADFLGGRRNMLLWHGGLGAVHLAVRLGHGAAVEPGLDRQSLCPVVRLDRHGQDHGQVVLVRLLRFGDGRGQPELPVRRRGGADLHGLAAGAGLGWRGVFAVAAGVLAVVVASWLWLKERPLDRRARAAGQPGQRVRRGRESRTPRRAFAS